MNSIRLTALLGSTLLFTGCGRCGPEPMKDDPPPAASAAAVLPAPGDVDPTAGEPIGIPACDDYFQKAKECFARNPLMKANMASGIQELRDSVRRIATASPERRPRLEEQCRQHAAALVDDCKN